MDRSTTGEKRAKEGGPVDDRGTDQTEARALLKRLRDEGFSASNEQLAVALGRPVEHVEAWMNGVEPVDDDVMMKARGIASDRNIQIE